MRIVKIDGDLFGLTVPREEDLLLLKLDKRISRQDRTLILDREFCYLGIRSSPGDRHSLHRKFSAEEDRPLYIGSDGEVDSYGECIEVKFLPVLIPLTSELTPYDCQRDNPDFEVSCGGSVYKNGKPTQFPWHPETILNLEIGDTDDSCSMVWRWFNGKLYWCGESMRVHAQELSTWLQLGKEVED